MTALMGRLFTFIHGAMSSQLHNYGVIVTLGVWALAVFATLVWPHQTRLDMAKDVGLVVLGWFFGVAGTHAYKAGKGVEESVREPKPDA